MSSGQARSPIANQPQANEANEANENAPSESPTNERSSAGSPRTPQGAHTGRLVWLLAALSFLFILNRNLRQGLAQPRNSDPYPYPVGPGDPDFVEDALRYDYLILNMNWPVTHIQRTLVERKKYANLPKFWESVNDYGYHFSIHGFRAGIWGEERLGGTRISRQRVEHVNRLMVDLLKHSSPLDKKKNCVHEDFDQEVPNRIAAVYESDKYWLDLSLHSGDFLSYEWNIHGKCVCKLKRWMTTCMDYFLISLDLGKIYGRRLDNALKLLYTSGFQHTERAELNYTSLLAALKSVHVDQNNRAYKIVFFWHPVRNIPIENQLVNEYWLESVNFCFDLDFQPIDCDITYQKAPMERNYKTQKDEIAKLRIPAMEAIGLDPYTEPQVRPAPGGYAHVRR